MAERSFKKEIQNLEIGKDTTFRGEGILAVIKALLESGVAYVGGYQGAPVSHLIDVLTDAQDLLDSLDVKFEANSNEASAAAMLAASIHYPLRGAVTWKSTVGTNVASDALSNLASTGVTGGALVILGEDYGEGSSIIQERSYAFAMKSQMWLLDPRPNLPSMVEMTRKAFDLSEASNTPVMMQLRIRACHLYGEFAALDNKRPKTTVAEALENPVFAKEKIVLPPAIFAHEKAKIEERLPNAVRHIKAAGLNEIFNGGESAIGIVTQGGLYNQVIRSLQMLNLADAYGVGSIPLYVLNVVYPLIDDEILAFCEGKKSVLLVEEGQPNYIEQALNTILRQNGRQTVVEGKSLLPAYGECDSEAVTHGLREYLAAWQPGQEVMVPQKSTLISLRSVEDIAAPRPPGFCTGCPERPFFSAMKMLAEENGPMHISADIGCNSFGTLEPFNVGNTIVGYGLGVAGASAFAGSGKRPISVTGDGGFWHNGLSSGVVESVYNDSDNITVVIENGYAAATGGQCIPSSQNSFKAKSKKADIETAVRGVGVNWVRKVDSYRIQDVKKTMNDALSTDYDGPKVVIVEGECMLNKQRREKPLIQKQIKAQQRVVKKRFFVDAKTCTGDHACVRLSGCPSLTIKPNPDPLREDPVAYVNNDCVGCGVCGEVAHAAVLCPSFLRAELIFNPSLVDKVLSTVRTFVIRLLQSFSERSKRRYVL